MIGEGCRIAFPYCYRAPCPGLPGTCVQVPRMRVTADRASAQRAYPDPLKVFEHPSCFYGPPLAGNKPGILDQPALHFLIENLEVYL